MDLRRAAKARPRTERAVLLLRPVSDALIAVLARRGIHPHAVVLTHAALGVLAAVLIVFGASSAASGPPSAWLAAAAALLLKAVLDNVDGGLARVTGRVTPLGRYLDTGMDLIVTTSLYAALAPVAGAGLAVAGWLASMAVLSLDHNMERLYRLPRTPASDRAPEGELGYAAPGGWAYRVFEGAYRYLLAPQDRWIERADRAAFRLAEGTSFDAAPRDRRLAWSDLYATATLAELGLTTQTLSLALLLAVGRPAAFPWLVLGMAAWALATQAARVPRYRAYRRAPGSGGTDPT